MFGDRGRENTVALIGELGTTGQLEAGLGGTSGVQGSLRARTRTPGGGQSDRGTMLLG